MCRVLEVSPRRFNDWIGPEASAHDESNRELLVHSKAVRKKSRRRYGSPRVSHQLRNNAVVCGENRVARIMHVNGMRAVQARNF